MTCGFQSYHTFYMLYICFISVEGTLHTLGLIKSTLGTEMSFHHTICTVTFTTVCILMSEVAMAWTQYGPQFFQAVHHRLKYNVYDSSKTFLSLKCSSMPSIAEKLSPYSWIAFCLNCESLWIKRINRIPNVIMQSHRPAFTGNDNYRVSATGTGWLIFFLSSSSRYT